MSSVLAPVRRHPVVTYVVLAFALSWAYWIPMLLRGDVVTQGGSTSHFPGLLGPAVAAVIVTSIIGGRAALLDLGSRLARWRVALRWYVLASVPIVVMLAVAAIVMAGGDGPTVDDFAEYSGLPSLGLPLVVLLVVLVGGYGEETGWRGFMTPELLRRRGRLVTSMVVAVVWFAWHAPLFGVVDTYRTMGAAIVPMLGIGLVSGSIVLTWLYLGSGGSVLIAVLFHSALNLASATAAGSGMAGIVVWNVVLVWAILVAIGWMVAPVPASRPLGTRLRDGWMIAILRSPLGRLFGGITVISYSGRRSGTMLLTPVECVSEAGRVIIFVADPGRKQWWQNVRANPGVSIAVGGRMVAGRATVHVGGDAGAEQDLATYVERRPRVRGVLGLPTSSALDQHALAQAARDAVTVRVDLTAVPEPEGLSQPSLA